MQTKNWQVGDLAYYRVNLKHDPVLVSVTNIYMNNYLCTVTVMDNDWGTLTVPVKMLEIVNE